MSDLATASLSGQIWCGWSQPLCGLGFLLSDFWLWLWPPDLGPDSWCILALVLPGSGLTPGLSWLQPSFWFWLWSQFDSWQILTLANTPDSSFDVRPHHPHSFTPRPVFHPYFKIPTTWSLTLTVQSSVHETAISHFSYANLFWAFYW